MKYEPFSRKAAKDNSYLFLGGVKVSFLVDGEDSQGRFSVIQMEERKGLELPPHIHHHDDETFYVLEGEVTYYVDNQAIDATPGSFVFAPRGIPHTYKLKTEQAKVLVSNYPSGFDQL